MVFVENKHLISYICVFPKLSLNLKTNAFHLINFWLGSCKWLQTNKPKNIRAL